ncbi:DUF1836 domain-containing protein [Oceanobacillus piezotolerans]|uniref:DUF1836 domain-containing protein n=1 Tax=Oceanobacillus piezotolerans TaxID=2448030 RepID=A0A498DD20_9BACI|nr:DUF1836 domain-containing protein [Oceanobacillus piezotolerans]RLL46560.1 DUF1836 domain-containing protein [Oceanobacillus piezotolerans]
MEDIRKLMEELQLETFLSVNDIPELDLYMDQVIQLFEKKYTVTKRKEEDKVLTKTMINNYAKGKLFFPVKNKKYTKEHIMLISMIYQMKGVLSIGDIKKSLGKLNMMVENEDFQLEALYERYETLGTHNVARFKETSEQLDSEIAEEDRYIRQLLMVASLTHMSNLFRKAAEKIVDEIEEEKKDS